MQLHASPYLCYNTLMPLQEDFERIANSEKIDFVPEFIHGLQYNYHSPEGFERLLIDVNDVRCLLTVGVPNRVEKPFFDAYCQAYEQAYGRSYQNETNPHVDRIARDGAYTWFVEKGPEYSEEEENDNGSSS